MGFKSTLKRLFGGQKKENEPVDDDAASVDSAENCEICRARAAEAQGNAPQEGGQNREPHYKKASPMPAPPEPGSGPSPDFDPTSRPTNDPRTDRGGQVPPSATHSDVKDHARDLREEGKGIPQDASDRVHSTRDRDLPTRSDAIAHTKDRVDVSHTGRDKSKQFTADKTHPSVPESRFHEPRDEDINKGRRTGIDIPSEGLIKQSGDEHPQLTVAHGTATNDQPFRSQKIDDHDNGFVGLGRTPGPSTTLMSDTRNGGESNPFDFDHGIQKSKEPRTEMGRPADIRTSSKLNSNAPEFVPSNKNPFRHTEPTTTAPTEGATSEKNLNVPQGVAAGGALGAGAGAYAAHELSQDHRGDKHHEGRDDYTPKGGPGSRDVSRSQTPLSLAEQSRDRLAPPSPPLSEKERSIEVGTRDEIDSQRFDPRAVTLIGREREDERGGSGFGETAAVAGGVGAGAALAGGAAHGHREGDQAGEERSAGGTKDVRKADDVVRGGLPHQQGDIDEISGTAVSSAQRLGTTSSGPTETTTYPKSGQINDAARGPGAQKPDKVEDVGPAGSGGNRKIQDSDDERGRSLQSSGIDEVLPCGADTKEFAAHAGGKGEYVSDVSSTEGPSTGSADLAQESAETDDAYKSPLFNNRLTAELAAGSGAGVAGASLGARRAASDRPVQQHYEETREQPKGVVPQPLKLNDEDVSTDDNDISSHPVSTSQDTVPLSDIDRPPGTVRGKNKDSATDKYGVGDTTGLQPSSDMATQPQDIEGVQSDSFAREHGKAGAGMGLAVGAAAAGTGAALAGRKSLNKPEAMNDRIEIPQSGSSPAKDSNDLAIPGVNDSSGSNDLGNVYAPSRQHPNQLSADANKVSCLPAIAFQDQFDERGTCFVVSSSQGPADPTRRCPEEELLEEDDHGMILCRQALASSRTPSSVAPTAPASARSAAPITAGGAALGAGAALSQKSTSGKHLSSSQPPQMSTIPGTTMPVTTKDEVKQMTPASATDSPSMTSGHNKGITVTCNTPGQDDEGDVDDVMAPSSVGGLAAPTATVAAQSAIEEQSSRVRDSTSGDRFGSSRSPGHGSSASNSPTDGGDIYHKAQTSTENQHSGLISAGIAAGTAGAASLLTATYHFIGLDNGEADSEKGSHQAGVTAESASTQSNMPRRPASDSSLRTDNACSPATSSRQPELQSRHQDTGTPSDEEAWTRLPSESNLSAGTGGKDVPEDSGSQYSVESPRARPHSAGPSGTGRILSEDIISDTNTGMFSAGAASKQTSSPEGQPTKHAHSAQEPETVPVRCIPGTAWTGDDDVQSNFGPPETVSKGTSDSTPAPHERIGSSQATPARNVPPEGASDTTSIAGAEARPGTSRSGDDAFQEARHVELMPGDWDLETAEEGSTVASTPSGAEERIPPAPQPLRDSKINRELEKTATVGGGAGLLSRGISDVIRREATTGPETTENAPPVTEQPSESGPDVDHRNVVARDFARNQLSEELPSPKAGSHSHEPAALGIGRSDASSTRAFEEALARNEHDNMLRTPRFTEDGPSPFQEVEGHGAGLATEKKAAGGQAAGAAGLGQHGGSELLPTQAGPRSESTGMATIEEPYIYRRPDSLTARPFPQSAVREGGLASAVPDGTSELSTEDLGSKPLPSNLPFNEVDPQDVESDYETDEDEEPLLLRDDLAEAAPVFPSMQHGDPVLDKEVVDHQEHYTGVLTHDLT